MSNYWNNQLLVPAPELLATMTGAQVKIGSLLYPPVKVIFDNQSTVSIVITTSRDNGNTFISWKTFPAGEALVIDDDFYTFAKGTTFYGLGASGVFSIAYLYTPQQT